MMVAFNAGSVGYMQPMIELHWFIHVAQNVEQQGLRLLFFACCRGWRASNTEVECGTRAQ